MSGLPTWIQRPFGKVKLAHGRIMQPWLDGSANRFSANAVPIARGELKKERSQPASPSLSCLAKGVGLVWVKNENGIQTDLLACLPSKQASAAHILCSGWTPETEGSPEENTSRGGSFPGWRQAAGRPRMGCKLESDAKLNARPHESHIVAQQKGVAVPVLNLKQKPGENIVRTAAAAILKAGVDFADENGTVVVATEQGQAASVNPRPVPARVTAKAPLAIGGDCPPDQVAMTLAEKTGLLDFCEPNACCQIQKGMAATQSFGGFQVQRVEFELHSRRCGRS